MQETLRPQVRFLLRGSVLMLAMLALWWVALLNPLLLLLRVSAELPLSFVSGSLSGSVSEDWTFRLPVEEVRAGVKVHSIEFTVPRADVVVFTFSLPVYWAIALAAGAKGRSLLWGTAALAAVEVLCLLMFVMIAERAIVAQWHPGGEGIGSWIRELGDYLVVNVIPFLAPVLIAVSVHRELRTQIFVLN